MSSSLAKMLIVTRPQMVRTNTAISPGRAEARSRWRAACLLRNRLVMRNGTELDCAIGADAIIVSPLTSVLYIRERPNDFERYSDVAAIHDRDAVRIEARFGSLQSDHPPRVTGAKQPRASLECVLFVC